jgi:hypothetical protein
MTAGEAAFGRRAGALTLGILGAVCGGISWALVNYADDLNLKFDEERFGVLLLPISVFPGIVFGLVIGSALAFWRHASILRGGGYAIASSVGYLAAFHATFYVLGNLGEGSSSGGPSVVEFSISGLPGGLAGSVLLGLATKFLFPVPGYRALVRSIVIGTLAGALLGLGSFDDHNGWGFLAFFVLWQGLYGASLAPLIGNCAR